MTSGNVSINPNETSSIIKVLSTVDSGYALVHGSCKNITSNETLAARCTLTANFMSFNRTFEDRLFTLYELNSQNMSFKGGLYCDVASVGVVLTFI
ncbi:10764_t:CDS:2 [Gigaspora margarita]|uniref:10764_t:CDS:1 n=1 Tax=Gigaspora margarita TaxID=4874 RepID=A0ABN7UJN7_GIGMA|nr:10764_t:CDS:2 [Gigaspora margarita]